MRDIQQLKEKSLRHITSRQVGNVDYYLEPTEFSIVK